MKGQIFLSPFPFIKSKTSNAHNSKNRKDKSILVEVLRLTRKTEQKIKGVQNRRREGGVGSVTPNRR